MNASRKNTLEIYNKAFQAAKHTLNEKQRKAVEEIYGPANVDGEVNEDLELLYKNAAKLVDKVIKNEVRRSILEDGVRMSGRGIDEIRPVGAIADVLPRRVHGSARYEPELSSPCGSNERSGPPK